MIKASKAMKRYIHIKKEDREFIMMTFKVSEQSVFNAIRYDTKRGNTDLAKRIRKLAIERGGIPMIEAPEWETLHDADGYIRQYKEGGVLLEIFKEGNWCDVYKNGKKMRRFEHLMISDLDGIQKYAERLS